MPLPIEHVARLRSALDALGVGDGPLLTAVSGGPDSVALLLMAHAALGERCRAATVDHGLRRTSAAEARFVAGLCADRGIPHAILAAPLPERAGRTANLSARARALRYRLLEEHARATRTPFVATAHHADDQVETVVMRLNRGAGVSGLAGIRARSGMIVRPLLGFRRHELADMVERCGVTPVADPSNLDDRFDRARLRKRLAGADWLDADAIGTSARALDHADQALDWMATCLAARRCTALDDGVSLRGGDLPFEMKRRLVHRCLRLVDPAIDASGPALVRMVAGLAANRGSTLGKVVARVGRDERGGIVWTFRPAPPRQSR